MSVANGCRRFGGTASALFSEEGTVCEIEALVAVRFHGGIFDKIAIGGSHYVLKKEAVCSCETSVRT